MSFWFVGILFFVITFGPRFFSLLNFKYGYFDLGLYTQLLGEFSRGDFNPVIGSLGETFFSSRPQPILWILIPISPFAQSSAFFVFLDVAAVLLTAGICSRFIWNKTSSSQW